MSVIGFANIVRTDAFRPVTFATTVGRLLQFLELEEIVTDFLRDHVTMRAQMADRNLLSRLVNTVQLQQVEDVTRTRSTDPQDKSSVNQ